MAKNIVIFSDGTGQEGGKGHNTNIYKLFNMIEDRTPRQIAFYDPGLGTGIHRLTGNVGGFGISRNIQQCYRFLFEHYEAGDKIFLFGFSRGAATVRSLSGFLHYFGILPKSRPELIAKAYGIYMIKDEGKRKAKAAAFLKDHHNMWTKVEFIGCYDTVAALGLPIKGLSVLLDGIPGFRHRFHNFRLSETIKHAYHALAVDDERKTFHPVLWEKQTEAWQTVKQVWFSGMHTDVGGGYKEQDLSDIPLVWLTRQAIGHGLLIYPKHMIDPHEDAQGVMHDSRGTWLTSLYRRERRRWDASTHGKPVVHASVLERHENAPGAYHPWILKMDHDVEPWEQWPVKEA